MRHPAPGPEGPGYTHTPLRGEDHRQAAKTGAARKSGIGAVERLPADAGPLIPKNSQPCIATDTSILCSLKLLIWAARWLHYSETAGSAIIGITWKV
jgi:hypothetical protein